MSYIREVTASSGVDFIIAQGTEGGGKTGPIGTMALVPRVVDIVTPVPVIAAGGIGDGRWLVAALALGACGVWCGTLFAAAQEAEGPAWYKEKCVSSTEEDTIFTRLYSGKTARYQKNRLAEAWDIEMKVYFPTPLQDSLINPMRQALEEQRRIDYCARPAGQVTGLIKEIRPAGAIVKDMIEQAEQIARLFA